jgi:hypothetical protein
MSATPSVPELPRFAPEEILTDQPTRAAKLKWVIVVDAAAAPGAAVNAVACVSAAVGEAVAGLLGPAGADASGAAHPGLPWAGCSILAADREALLALRARAAARPDLLVVDMPQAAQATRVYDDYLATLAQTAPDALDLLAVAIVGPRNPVDRIAGKLPLYR